VAQITTAGVAMTAAQATAAAEVAINNKL
jgi:hypothetical protein